MFDWFWLELAFIITTIAEGDVVWCDALETAKASVNAGSQKGFPMEYDATFNELEPYDQFKFGKMYKF